MSHSITNTVEQPIFLVGAERSGTTLLRLMLDQHPRLAWCFETEYAVDLVNDDGEPPPLEYYYDWLETNRIFQATGFKINPHLSYPQLIRSFLAQKLERDQKEMIGATVHHHFDRLTSLWPNARFIHIIRDPRDVARSCVKMGWAGNVWAGVERWMTAENTWQRLKAKLLPSQWIELRYELLITDPVKELTRLCEFIGISYDEAMLRYPEVSTYEYPDQSLVMQWRNKLTEWEVRLVESQVGNMLIDRGYQLSQLPKLSTASIELRLKLGDWWKRKQFRLKRYGLPLILSDFLARRFGLKQWQKQTQLRLNSIETAYLK